MQLFYLEGINFILISSTLILYMILLLLERVFICGSDRVLVVWAKAVCSCLPSLCILQSGADLVLNSDFKETIFMCLQCAKGSDAFSGEPREGHSPEWAGGPAVQVPVVGWPSHRVWGHGTAQERGSWHAKGNEDIRSSWEQLTMSVGGFLKTCLPFFFTAFPGYASVLLFSARGIKTNTWPERIAYELLNLQFSRLDRKQGQFLFYF